MAYQEVKKGSEKYKRRCETSQSTYSVHITARESLKHNFSSLIKKGNDGAEDSVEMDTRLLSRFSLQSKPFPQKQFHTYRNRLDMYTFSGNSMKRY